MSGASPIGVPDALDPVVKANVDEAVAVASVAMSLATEEVAIFKRVRRTLVQATRTTSSRDQVLEAELEHEHVVIERVPVGRVVDAVPPVRQEGDVTIMPVVEEEVVVVRRLVLKEEVHLRRVPIHRAAHRDCDPSKTDRQRVPHGTRRLTCVKTGTAPRLPERLIIKGHYHDR